MLTIHSGTDGTALVADGGLLAAVGPSTRYGRPIRAPASATGPARCVRA